ncbi:hypothetical protein HMPREF0294_1791 [Corynebacterium glucuronolyticum ATCC 51867]|nr:hypothetical protein HMPREF0294_1791 [Corynebacterium glucuronolyticum ATCC 51867]WKD63845.1 hypothetical protein CGLUCO_07990 [Corynebacterium glucuronolyticum DSM 44120]SMB86178.1 hypothetical protein SAMN05660745_01615 [Corynebacterium glucuronolyticum]
MSIHCGFNRFETLRATVRSFNEFLIFRFLLFYNLTLFLHFGT